jgi:chromosomal replication initiator protein
MGIISYISQIMKRVSILKNILYRDGVEIPEEIIEYVARIKSNVRELEGAIISLIAQSSFNKKSNYRVSKEC